MNLRNADLEWLASNFPELAYAPDDRQISGELRFCAAFDRDSGQLKLGDTDEHRTICAFLCDAFNVRIDLSRLRDNGWPTVYEVGGRRFDIAEQNRCDMADLHFFEDEACCLGLKYAPERNLTIERFMPELVIPFFYRLAYTDRYGLVAARDNLWGEYSHGGVLCILRGSPTPRQEAPPRSILTSRNGPAHTLVQTIALCAIIVVTLLATVGRGISAINAGQDADGSRPPARGRTVPVAGRQLPNRCPAT